MTSRSRAYWLDQAKEAVARTSNYTDRITHEMMEIFEISAARIEAQINGIFSRYAIDNHLPYDEARRMLSGQEYSRWRMSLDSYMRDISAEGRRSKIYLELNTLSAKAQISRQEQLLGDIYSEIIRMAGDSSMTLERLLGDLYSVSYYRSGYSIQRGLGVQFNMAKLNPKLIQDVISYPWSQKHFSTAIWGHADTIAAMAKREIAVGFATGSSVQKMARQIDGVLNRGRYVTERLVRTECKYFATRAELDGFRANGIKKYRYIGGTEMSISCDCPALNGKVFAIEDAEPGVNAPPMHPNCLCIIVADFGDFSIFVEIDVTPLHGNVKFKEWMARQVA